MKPMMKAPGTNDEQPSKFAFKFYLRRYSLGDTDLLKELPPGLKDDVLLNMHSNLRQGELLRGASRELAAGPLFRPT